MLILDRLSKSHRPLAVALGTFDGLHLGHTALIAQTVQDASDRNLESAVFTFAQHPLSVLRPGNEPGKLVSVPQRHLLYRAMGVQQLCEVDFTLEMAALQPGEFIHQYLLPAEISLVEVGFNFRFGARGMGDPDFLLHAGKQFGFEVKVLEPVCVQGEPVSSSRIRQAVAQGDFAAACSLLGRPYSIQGKCRDGIFETDPGICLPNPGRYEVSLENADNARRAQVRIAGRSILMPMMLDFEPTQVVFL